MKFQNCSFVLLALIQPSCIFVYFIVSNLTGRTLFSFVRFVDILIFKRDMRVKFHNL